jgi:hypothetical protein
VDPYTIHDELSAKLRAYHCRRTIFFAAMLASGLPMFAFVILAPLRSDLAWAALPLALLFSISAGFYSHYVSRVLEILWELRQTLHEETEED